MSANSRLKLISTRNLLFEKLSGENIHLPREIEFFYDDRSTCQCCKKILTKKFLCSDCRIAVYCTKICQKQDWIDHKVKCHDVHGINWTLEFFPKLEKEYIEYGIKDSNFLDSRAMQYLVEGKNISGCCSTSQILAIFLCHPINNYWRDWERVITNLNTCEDNYDTFENTLEYLGNMQHLSNLSTAFIYSCVISAYTKDDEIFSHVFTITQYAKADADPTYCLWQAYAKKDCTLIYSLNQWFDLKFEIKGVHPDLRKEMSALTFKELFLYRVRCLMSNTLELSENWVKLFGFSGIPECENIGFHFIVGNAQQYLPYLKPRR